MPAPVGEDVGRVEEAAMAALAGLLPERRGRDHGRRVRAREAAAAVVGRHLQDRVVPAGEIIPGRAEPRMGVRLELVVHEGRDPAPVIGPGGRDPARVVVAGRIGRAARPQRRRAIDLQPVEIGPAERPVQRVEREQHHLPALIAEGARVGVRHVVAVAGVPLRVEHGLGRSDHGRGQQGRLGRAGARTGHEGRRGEGGDQAKGAAHGPARSLLERFQSRAASLWAMA